MAGKAGLVVQALLLNRDRSWSVAEMATEAGVSSGLAHRVLARLEDADVVAAAGIGPRKVRRITEPAALLDLWVDEEKEPGVRLTAAYILDAPESSGQSSPNGWMRPGSPMRSREAQQPRSWLQR